MSAMREPDYVGQGRWRAWTVTLPPIGQRETKALDAAIATWLLFCPGAHAAWSYWWVALIHLRPLEGVKPAMLQFDGARYEVLCAAQDPDCVPDPADLRTVRYLRPLDWVVQFADVADDATAERVGIAVVQTIMSGKVSPDQDFRSYWQETIPATAKCHAEGRHPQS